MDLVQRGTSLLFSQYKNSTLLIKTLAAFTTSLNDCEQQLEALFDQFIIDDATGEDLDIIGWLAGLPRFPIETPTQTFQFDVTPFDQGYHFGDEAWANFRMANDDEYRRGIKSFIIVRNSIGNTNDLIISLALLLGLENSDIVVTPVDTVTVNVAVNKTFNVVDISMLNYIVPNGSNLWAKLPGYNYTVTGT